LHSRACLVVGDGRLGGNDVGERGVISFYARDCGNLILSTHLAN
jgi:hypothetical protein